MIPDTDGLYPGITERAYHADRSSLSSSGARTLLKSPARFKYERDHPVFKDVFDMGSVAHTLVLGEGSEIVVVDADSWRSKAAKEAKDAARAEGKTPILAADYQVAREMADAIGAHPTAAKLLSSGSPELSGYWHDSETDIRLRFRTDWLTEYEGRPLCVDYKTAASADPDEFAKSAARYGYHLQAAWYVTGLQSVGVDAARMVFICQEKTAPYLVSVVELDEEAVAEGARLARQAVDLYHQCVTTGQWPGYPEHIVTLSLPRWARNPAIQSIADDVIAELEGMIN